MRLVCVLGLIGLMAIGALSPIEVAWAQSGPDKAEADRLFRDARSLLAQRRYAEACRLFERSLEIESSPGTLLNLGACHEQAGDLVRALVTFERAIADARLEADPKKRDAWVEAGTRRANSLAGRVAVVTLRPSPSSGASVSLDGNLLTRVGEALRLNPGRHVVRVQAPGKRPFDWEFTLTPGQVLKVALPKLADPPPYSRPGTSPIEFTPPALTGGAAGPGAPSPGRSIGPWIVMGSGAALVTGGVVTAVLAKSKENELERGCGPGPICQDTSLQSTRDSGESLALATYLLWGAGGIGVAGGLVWLLLDQNPEQSGSALSASCSGSGCTLIARGSF